MGEEAVDGEVEEAELKVLWVGRGTALTFGCRISNAGALGMS